MSLRPRHFVLLAIIIGLFVFNVIRNRRHQPLPSSQSVVKVTSGPPVDTPVWRAFDHAAGLRDASNALFDPAMQGLLEQIDLAASNPATSDVKGCLTWLQFYRQGVNHPSNDTQWKDRSQRHLDGCVKFHLDTTS